MRETTGNESPKFVLSSAVVPEFLPFKGFHFEYNFASMEDIVSFHIFLILIIQNIDKAAKKKGIHFQYHTNRHEKFLFNGAVSTVHVLDMR